MDMDLKDKFDAHYKLADIYRLIRNERRGHEWKVTLGLWALLAVGIVSVDKLPSKPICLAATIMAIFLIVILIYHWLWAADNFRLRNRDANKSYDHLFIASEIAGRNNVDPANTRIRDKYPFFEAAGTTILCAALGVIYGFHLWSTYHQ